jgi:hypothetical protein
LRPASANIPPDRKPESTTIRCGRNDRARLEGAFIGRGRDDLAEERSIGQARDAPRNGDFQSSLRDALFLGDDRPLQGLAAHCIRVGVGRTGCFHGHGADRGRDPSAGQLDRLCCASPATGPGG